MNHRALLPLTAATFTLILTASPATAQVNTYDFSTVVGEYTSPTTTIGIATFSSPYDSANQIPNNAGTTGPTGEFVFGPTGGLFSTFTSSDMLSSAGYVGAGVQSGTPYSPAVLDITFSKPQSAVSFDFATSDFFGADGNDSLSLTTNTGATASFGATVPDGDFYPEGSVDFTSATPFTSLVLRTTDSAGDQDLNLADLTSTNAVPEPSSWTLALIALSGISFLRLRHRQA